jgi:class 3 adenylate cyclase
MYCPLCGFENPEGMKFCGQCASPLGRRCPQCGFDNPQGFAFCGQCATPLTAVPSIAAPSPQTYTPAHLAEKILTSQTALEGEREQVTVLLADLKGSMELLADREPEAGRQLLDPVLERMMAAVHRYKGIVNQVMGDDIMALFGAPIAHEDHAVRACSSALAMPEAIRRCSEEVRRGHGVGVQIRVGLHSGEVVVRSIGNDLHIDYSAIGQTTHLVARMKQLATHGSIRRQAHMRQDVSRLLGVHRKTMSLWLAIDAAGGLTALLATYIPGGKPVSLAPAVLARLEQALRLPGGFASYEALRQWVQRTPGVEASTRRSTHWYARASTRCSKCHALVTQNNPEAIPTFQASCDGHLQRAIPPANTRPVHVFRQDESRFGLLTIHRQRLTTRGVQPIGTVQHVFEWLSIYGAVGHTTGDRFFVELPDLNAEMFQLFVDAFAQAFRDSLNLLVLDNSGALTAQRRTLPENVRLVCLPPYCPELNPMERVWRDLKDALA